MMGGYFRWSNNPNLATFQIVGTSLAFDNMVSFNEGRLKQLHRIVVRLGLLIMAVEVGWLVVLVVDYSVVDVDNGWGEYIKKYIRHKSNATERKLILYGMAQDLLSNM